MPQNHVLGRGKIYLRSRNREALATFTSGERYTGNTPEMTLANESDTLDHYSADAGVKVKDRSVTLEVNRSGSFICDDISKENVAMFFLGTSSTYSQTGGSTSDEQIEVEQDYYYQLGESTSNPGGARNVSSVVVGDDATPTTTYVDGTDYTIDLVTGRLYIIVGGAIASGAAQTIFIDYTSAAETRDHVVSGDDDFVGSMRFVSDNPEGQNKDYYFPYVKISPNGDFSLKGDDWQQMPFNVEVLKLDDNTQAVYVDGRAA